MQKPIERRNILRIMIKEEIKIYDDLGSLHKGFTDLLIKLLDAYPQVNLCLSGGNTPKSLFEYWAVNHRETIDWERIMFFWGDERCVPPRDEMSNFGMTKDFLFNKIETIKSKGWRRIHGENDPEEEAEWYSRILKTKVNQRNDIPTFEILMLGLGDDGHTVSIFPQQMELWDSEDLCVVAEHPETGMKRVSITGKVVNNAQYAVFLVTGKNKAEKVRDIIKNREALVDKYPAARVNPEKGYLYWFLDKDAASLL